MANVFRITIMATDKATAVVKKFNNQMAQATKPIRQIRNSVASLGRELGLDRLAKVGKKLAGGLENIVKKAATAASALLAIAGISTIASVAALTRQWAAAGYELFKLTSITGMSADSIQGLTQGFVAFGGEAATMQQAIASLGTTMEDAFYGRNQAAMVMMNKLGIGLHRTKGGAVDVRREACAISLRPS